MRMISRKALAAALVLGSTVFASLPGADKNEISLTLRDKVIRNLSSTGLTLAFHIAVRNADSAEWHLTRYRYRVTVEQKEFLNMDVTLDEPMALPAGGEVLVALPVKVTYALLFDAVGPIEEKAHCDVVGDVYFENPRRREERASLALSGEFPIFEDPELEFLPVKVNDLTVGGADIVFRPFFRNSLKYDFLVDSLSYRLFLGEREVLSGAIPGEKTIPRLGERAFDLPFIVDFFDLGQEVRPLFEKGAVPFRFQGEMEIASVWGRLRIAFDRSEDVPLEKKT